MDPAVSRYPAARPPTYRPKMAEMFGEPFPCGGDGNRDQFLR
jgi:hypothetical protein